MDSSASTVATNANLNNVQSNMIPDYTSQIQKIADITNSNNAQARFNADEQRSWTERMARQTNEFNAAEAAKNRDWQSMMSNTAHQREIKDLQAAGLNPILSAMGGNGASVTSGATASGAMGSTSAANTDMSGNAALMSLLGNMLTAQTRLAEMTTSANTNIAVADKYNAMNGLIAQIQSDTSKDVAKTHANASMYGSDVSASATRDSAATHAAASRYGADSSAQASRDVEAAREAHDTNIHQNYPSSTAGIVGALLSPEGGIGSAVSNFNKSATNAIQGLPFADSFNSWIKTKMDNMSPSERKDYEAYVASQNK